MKSLTTIALTICLTTSISSMSLLHANNISTNTNKNHIDLTYNHTDMYGDKSIYKNQKHEHFKPTSEQLYIYNTKNLDRSTNFHRTPQIPYSVKIHLKPNKK